MRRLRAVRWAGESPETSRARNSRSTLSKCAWRRTRSAVAKENVGRPCHTVAASTAIVRVASTRALRIGTSLGGGRQLRWVTADRVRSARAPGRLLSRRSAREGGREPSQCVGTAGSRRRDSSSQPSTGQRFLVVHGYQPVWVLLALSGEDPT